MRSSLGTRMNAHSHERDIRIGKGAWILNACVAPELEDVLNVDSHFQGLDEFFAALEIHCLSECCGIHAFDFDGEAVRNAAMDFDHEMLLVRLSALETSLHDSSEGIIESSRLNHYLTRRAFL